MGLFLTLSGVIGADESSVAGTIGSFVSTWEGTFEPMTGTTDDRHVTVISGSHGNCTIFYPNDFMGSEELSQHLSQQRQTPVFSFHIHDGDLWTFQLFDKGNLVTRFNPIPDYWDELGPAERRSWSGDADAISACIPSVPADSIRNYFVEWTDEYLNRAFVDRAKAYPDDNCVYGDEWQLTDFMRRLGLEYPVLDGTIIGRTYRLRIRRARL